MRRKNIMTKEEAIQYIENFTWSTTRLGLSRTRELLERTGNPQKDLKFVHVAGSNGKGSTCAMLESVLRCAGYKTGLYISPYIQDFCERIRVNGKNIPPDDLAAVTEKIKTHADAMEDHPSQFELVTAVAFEYFKEQDCDIVVLEVGMGGELDSTNVIDAPEVAVITNIGLEHTEYLGNTIGEIARTKGGIIKAGCSAVCYDGEPEAKEVIEKICEKKGVKLYMTDFSKTVPCGQSLDGQNFILSGDEDVCMAADKKAKYFIPLIGPHQLKNAAVVLKAIEALRDRGWNIPESAVKEGLANTKWPARFEVLSRDPLFILDGGHNPQCAAALRESVETLVIKGDSCANFILGVLRDKDYEGIIDILKPYANKFFCVTPENDRALSADELAGYLIGQGIDAQACAGIQEAIISALENTSVAEAGQICPESGLIGKKNDIDHQKNGTIGSKNDIIRQKSGDTCPKNDAAYSESGAAGSTAVIAFGSLYLAGEIRTHFPGAYKKYLRRRGAAARNSLSREEVSRKSRDICDRIIRTPQYKQAETIMVYSAIKNEVCLDRFIEQAGADGKKVAYPTCTGSMQMEARIPYDSNSWKSDYMGLKEPDPQRSQLVSPEDIDLIVCPCVAFDSKGNRIGQGGGYYDRYISRCGNAKIMAAAFACQKVPEIHPDPWDASMETIVTEAGIF